MKLLNFMETRWGISLGDEKSKLKILGLTFLAYDKQTGEHL